jgi:hypothetical protein
LDKFFEPIKIARFVSGKGVNDLSDRLESERVSIVFHDELKHILLGPFINETAFQINTVVPFVLDTADRFAKSNNGTSHLIKDVATGFFVHDSGQSNAVTTTLVKILIDGEHRTENLLSDEVKTILGSTNCDVMRVFEIRRASWVEIPPKFGLSVV